MKAIEIIKNAMKLKSITQTVLAKKAGLKSQSDVSRILKNENMKITNFVSLLNSMDFKVVVIGKDKSDKPIRWELDNATPKTSLDLDALLSDAEQPKKSVRIPLR
jgi:transcriptional regulator with XRE-family HTH domain